MSEQSSRPGVVRRFFGESVRPYLGLQIEIGICLIVSVALEIADPLILRVVIDRALGDRDEALLVTLVALLGGVLVFRVAFRLITVWLYSYSGLRILFDFRQRVFEHVERLSVWFFRRERAGDILARLTTDIDALQRAAAHTVVKAVQDLLTIAVILSALLWLNAPLTLGLILLYPLLIFLLSRINRRLRSESLAARDAIGGLYMFLEERLGRMRVVQEFRREIREAQQHVKVSRPWIASNLKMSVIGAGQVSLADAMVTGAFIVVFLLGGLQVIDGSLSLGSLVAFYTLASRLYRPISGLIDINIDLQVARAALGRVYALLDEAPEIEEAPNATVPESRPGEIAIDHVGLRWPDGSRALEDVTLRIAAGQVVSLVGPSGSGKSTLAASIGRFVDPGEGTIHLDGLDVRQWRLGALRRHVGLVTQETQLFHDTLAANLRLAKRRASDDELWSALRVAGLEELVRKMPDGLETLVGEEGQRLSGGERQRLALARILLKRPRVLVLDEATAALDAETERTVLERLLAAASGCTVVIVGHRLSALTFVDRIFVLSGGRLVESGSHAELMSTGGLYRRLFELPEEERSEPLRPQ
ncbi:MAG: ABC transporter ATP-binding protein [Planctomycetota bacterium]